MLITLCLITLVWFSETQAEDSCHNALNQCKKDDKRWTTCYEERLMTCVLRGRSLNFIRTPFNSSNEAEVVVKQNKVNIPASALQKSRGSELEGKVTVVATMISSTLFQDGKGGQGRTAAHSPHRQGTIMAHSVLVVKAGNQTVRNLSEPVRLTFKNSMQVENGTCVFWQEAGLRNETGYWNTDGCETNNTGNEFICSCNHLSFFAVLVNPNLSVKKSDAVVLNYITYIGSGLSVIFTIISLIIYAYLQQWRSEKAIGLHMQLTGALLCLHLTFLLCSHWVWLLKTVAEDWVCSALGLLLHWSFLATFSWIALEGFHLYLLLARVFNIYIRRYLLKLSLVGWGLPTMIAVACGISGVYGKYSLEMKDDKNSTVQMCWMSSQFPQRLSVSYITTVAFPCLVILFNCCMLCLVVFKLWGLRRCGGGRESSVGKKTNKERWSAMLKDCATLLGLSCILGLPWGLASITYVSIPGIYVFTILNSLQGVFMFLWSLALTHKAQSDNNSSIKDSSSQKMMTTSFNN